MVDYNLPRVIPNIPAPPKQADFNLPVAPSMSIRIPELPLAYDKKYRLNNLYMVEQRKRQAAYMAERQAQQAAYEAETVAKQKATEEKMAMLSDYTSDSEVNSWADVLYNAIEPGNDWWEDATGLVKRTAIDPLVQAITAETKEERRTGWSVFGLNALYNFAETADVLANPVKGAVIGAFSEDQTVIDNVKAAVGIGTEGRTNFDYNFTAIDNKVLKFVAEMGAEIVSDPFSWITFGAAGLAKGAATGAAKKGIGEITEASAKQIGKRFARALIRGASPDDAALAAVKGTRNYVRRMTTMLERAGVPIKKLTAHYGDDLLGDLTPDIVRRGIMENNAYQVAKTIGAARTAEAIDSAVISFALGSSTAFAPHAIKAVLGAPTGRAFNAILKRMDGAWTKYVKPGTDVTKINMFNVAARDYVDEVRVSQLIDFIDEHELPRGIVDLKFNDTIRHEADELRKVYTQYGTDTAELVAQLDAYVLKNYPEFRTFSNYANYIEDLATRGTLSGELTKLTRQLDVVKLVYNRANAERAAKQVDSTMDIIQTQVNPIMGAIEDAASYHNMEYDELLTYLEVAKREVDEQMRLMPTDAPDEVFDRLARRQDELDAVIDNPDAEVAIELLELGTTPGELVFDLTRLLDNISQLDTNMFDDLLDEIERTVRYLSGLPADSKVGWNIDNLLREDGLFPRIKSRFDIARKRNEHTIKSTRKSITDMVAAYDQNSLELLEKAGVLTAKYSDMTIQVEDVANLNAIVDNEAMLDDIIASFEPFKELTTLHADVLKEQFDNLRTTISYTLNAMEDEVIRPQDMTALGNVFDSTIESMSRTTNAVVTEYQVKGTPIDAGLVSVLKDMGDVQDVLSSAYEKVFVEPMISTKAGKKFYQLKTSQVHNVMKLLDADGLRQFVDQVVSRASDGPGAAIYATMLDPLSNELDIQAAQKLIGMSEAIYHYDKFMDQILDSGLEETQVIALLDTIQGSAQQPMSKIIGREDAFIYSFLKRAEEQMNVTKAPRSLSLEKLRMQMGLSGNAHDAVDDVLFNKRVAEEQLDMDKLIMDNETAVWYDIETLGINQQANQIFQLAYHNAKDGKTYNIKTIAERMPEESLRRKLAPKELTTDQQRVEWFKREYMDPDKIGTMEEVDGVVTMYVKSEADLLTNFDQYVNNLRQADQRPVLVGHNIHDFDQNVIENRMKFNEVKPSGKVHSVDTLTEFRKQDGYVEFSKEESALMAGHLKSYINSRANQISDIWDTTNGLDHIASDFIETPSAEFIDAIRTVNRRLQLSVEEGFNRQGIEGVSEVYSNYSAQMRDVASSVQAELSDIKALNGYYGNYFIELDDEYVQKAATQDELPWNITKALNEQALEDGKFMSIGYRTVNDTDLVNDYYKLDIKNKEIPVSSAVRHQRSAKLLERVRQKVDNMSLVYEHIDGIKSYIDMMSKRINDIKDNMTGIRSTLFGNDTGMVMALVNDPAVTMDVAHLNESQLYAVANRYYHIASELKKVPAIGNLRLSVSLSEELDRILANVDELSYKDRDIIGVFVDPKLLKDSDLEDGFRMHAEIQSIAGSFENYSDKMRRLIAAHEDNKIITAESRLKVSMMEDIYSAFHRLRGDVDALKNKYGLGPEYRKHYRNIISEFEHYQNALGINSLHLALDKTPEEMLSRLYHESFGVMTFRTDDLIATPTTLATEVKPGITLDAYTNIKKNLADYEALGIKLYETDERIWIYLDKNADYSNVKRISDKRDLEVLPLGGDVLGGKYYEDMLKAKNTIEFYSDGKAKNTLGEKFDKGNYADIMDAAPQEVRDGMFSIADLDDRFLFDGLQFNRSVLGSIDSKKDVLPYISRNILKNYSQTTQAMTSQVDSITRYASIFTDVNNTLNGPMFKNATNEDVFAFLKNHPEYRIAEAIENKKKGIKISSRQVKTLKDVEYARANDMVVAPEFVINKAKSVINAQRVSNELVRLLDKFWIGPMKLGYLTSLGFLGRNFLDSNIKNVVTAQQLDILPFTMDVWAKYHNYKKVLREILGTYKDVNAATIDQYFKGTPVMDKDLFQLIYTFIKDGPSAGHSAELQRYFDDDAIRLHRHSRLPKEVLTLDDVRAVLGDRTAVEASNRDPEVIAELLRLEKEELFLDQAKSMAIHSKNNMLNVDTLVNYIKRPDTVPPALEAEFKRLQKYKSQRSVEKFFEKTIYNKGTQAITNANGHLEQVFRLTQFLYTIDKGGSIDEAIHNVVKTHFDPTHKTAMERGLEMLFPFSTFTIKNMHYWLDSLLSKGATGRVFRDMMTPVWDFDREIWANGEQIHDKWDYYHRMSLQYLITSGNVPLDEIIKTENYYKNGEQALHYSGDPRYKHTLIYNTLKVSPSIMDTINLLLNPQETIKSRLVTPLRAPLEATIWDEDWDGDGVGDTTWKDAALQMVPYVGNFAQKYSTGWKYYNDTGNLLDFVLPTVFGRSKIDSWVDKYQGNPNFDEGGNWIGPRRKPKATGFNWWEQTQGYRQTHRYVPGVSYQKQEYPQGFASLPKKNYMYNPMVYRNGQAVLTRGAHNMWYNKTDFYKDLFTTGAKSKLKLGLMPITPDNIKYRIRH